MTKNFCISIFVLVNSCIFPQNEIINNSKIGFEYYHSDNYSEALKYFLEAYNKNEQGNYNLSLEIGNCYRLLGNIKESLIWLNKALQYKKEGYESRIYYLIGSCYKSLNKDNNADKYFKLAEEYGIPYPPEYKFEEEGWFFLINSGADYIYYQKKSVKNLKNGIIRIWLKWFLDENSISDEDHKKMVELNIDLDKLTEMKLKDREGIKYSIRLEEYNCDERKSKILSITSYDKNDQLITFSEFDSAWSYIVPGSVGDVLIDEICKLK